jgi:hypothetical protein
MSVTTDQQIEQYLETQLDYKYNDREKVLARTSFVDLMHARRRNLLIALALPGAYFGLRKQFAPVKFIASSYVLFSGLNYFNERRHDTITRQTNIWVSEQINTMMDLE